MRVRSRTSFSRRPGALFRLRERSSRADGATDRPSWWGEVKVGVPRGALPGNGSGIPSFNRVPVAVSQRLDPRGRTSTGRVSLSFEFRRVPMRMTGVDMNSRTIGNTFCIAFLTYDRDTNSVMNLGELWLRKRASTHLMRKPAVTRARTSLGSGLTAEYGGRREGACGEVELRAEVPLNSQTPASLSICYLKSRSTGDSAPLFVSLRFGLNDILPYPNPTIGRLQSSSRIGRRICVRAICGR